MSKNATPEFLAEEVMTTYLFGVKYMDKIIVIIRMNYPVRPELVEGGKMWFDRLTTNGKYFINFIQTLSNEDSVKNLHEL